MKTRTILGLSAVFCLLLVSTDRAAGQGCALVITPYYSNYANQSGDSNNNIYQTVTTNGYAQINPSAGCPMNSATHTPWVENQLTDPYGHVYGGTYRGSSGCPSCYLSEQNTLTVAATDGEIFTDNNGGDVVCSAAGEFWSVFISFRIEIAKTLSQNTGPGPGAPSYWAVSPYCTPATTPPDYAPRYATVSNWYPYYLQRAICWPQSGAPPNGVLCLPTSDTGQTPPQNQYNCTKQLQ
jgi:hypothetical protein